MEINRITKEEALNIIKSYKPQGLFLYEDDGFYIGIDNTTSECWVEEFKTEDLCIKWLLGEIEMFDLE